MNRITDHLRVAALPLPIVTGDKKANIDAVRSAFQVLPQRTDIVVLPELFSTGYIDDAAIMNNLAERNTQDTVDILKELAKHYSVAIAGSYLASTPPNIYNRGFFIEPNGDETYYDKRHLFSLSKESQIFTHGDKPSVIVRFRGWNISLIVCYDLRFPIWCRNKNNAFDLLLVPANWPQSRGYAWEHLLIARAIENQCCVVGADCGGSDKFGSYEGLTQIYDGRGIPVGFEDGPFVVADLSRKIQDEYRRNFPVANDADDFDIII